MRNKECYRKCGTSELWMLSAESCEVYVYSDRGDRILRADAELTTDLLPGFRIFVRQLFETL
jgi:hypothetical protein